MTFIHGANHAVNVANGKKGWMGLHMTGASYAMKLIKHFIARCPALEAKCSEWKERLDASLHPVLLQEHTHEHSKQTVLHTSVH